MKQRLFSLLSVAIFSLFFACSGQVFSGAVQAQTPDFSSVAIEEVTAVEEDATLAAGEQVDPAQVQAVMEQYYRDVEAYRNTEQRYNISREQYYQLNTLAAQEDAIQRGKELLQARAQVLRTYYTYLRLVLLRTKGIELAAKEETLEQLETQIDTLRFYQERVGELTRREEIAAEFAVLNEESETLRALAYSSQALIKIGQLQVAIDQAYATRELIYQWMEQASLTAASRAVKDRGMEEVDRLLQRADNNLDEVTLNWVNRTSTNRFTESTYQQFQSDAEFTYLQLRQALSFLEEIVRGS